MEAAEAKLSRILHNNSQFLVPHYQRPYSWKEEQWKTLWRDVLELLEDEGAQPHFLGSIVTSPARSVPEGVEKRLLIDGQQRLTTLLVLLAAIRDRARQAGTSRLADQIHNLYLTNQYEEGTDHFKILPTQGEDPSESDRETFTRLVSGSAPPSKTGIGAAYRYFESKLRRDDAPDLEVLHRTVVGKLTLVSIKLDEKDNPHRIFESLNGTGRPLTQADLIRNFFFMRLPAKEHERTYNDFWRPMQRRLGEDALTDFVRHYLTRFGQVVRETDVYASLKRRVDEDQSRKPLDHLKELGRYSEHYEVLLRPQKAPSSRLRERLERLNRLEVTVAYPFLLGVYEDFAAGIRKEEEVCAVLDTLENFLVRRFVCGVPTHGLNKIFAPLYEQAKSGADFPGHVRALLGASPRSYPRDDVFRERLESTRLYGGGERREKTKLILERLEGALGHKEAVPGTLLTIEHVMPQSLTDVWKEELGPTWEEDHEQVLHTLGNLTLTSYNPELSNSSFGEKKKLFAKSHIELNRYFEDVGRWTAEAIERRAEVLADHALALWPYFGPQQPGVVAQGSDEARVTGTIPKRVRIRGDEKIVQSWVDVAVATVEGIIRVGDDEFNRLVAELPKFVNTDATAFRRSSRLKKLSNGAYVETNLSAVAIHRFCVQAVQLAGLAADAWSVEYTSSVDEEEEPENAPSHVRQLQLEFWTEVRSALSKTGKFTSLRSPKPQHWFDVALGRSNVWMRLTANTMDGEVGVKIVLAAEVAERALELLTPQREAIERELRAALQWNPHPEKRVKTVKLTRPTYILDKNTWPAAIDWLTSNALSFRDAFGPRVADLDLRRPE